MVRNCIECERKAVTIAPGERGAPIGVCQAREGLFARFRNVKRGQRCAWAGRDRGTGDPGVCHLEVIAKRELHAPRIARAEDLAEERPEIGIGAGDAPVRVVEDVEAFGAEADGAILVNRE